MKVVKGYREENLRLKKKKIALILLTALAVVMLALLIAFLVIRSKYRVKTVCVEGNKHYTPEEIKSFVITDSWWTHNSLFLSMKYKHKEITGIPFIDSMDVDIVSAGTIRIRVYEKALAGCVKHLGLYAYFDKDGTVTEIAGVMTDGVPLITGLSFDEIVLKKKLPVADEGIFTTILDLTKILEKYNLVTDQIYFNAEGEITLFFGKVRVNLGYTDYLEEKCMNLTGILNSLVGESGVLLMENYTGSQDDITFVKDRE